MHNATVNTDSCFYPTPLSDQVFINLPARMDATSTVTLTGIDGRRVQMSPDHVHRSGAQQLRVELPVLIAGTYVVEVGDPSTRSCFVVRKRTGSGN